MTRKYPFTHHHFWYFLYYTGLGEKHSINKLHDYVQQHHKKENHPSKETLRDWCKKEKWNKKARLYDSYHTIQNPNIPQIYLTDYVMDDKQMLGLLMNMSAISATQMVSSLSLRETSLELATLTFDIAKWSLELIHNRDKFSTNPKNGKLKKIYSA